MGPILVIWKAIQLMNCLQKVDSWDSPGDFLKRRSQVPQNKRNLWQSYCYTQEIKMKIKRETCNLINISYSS